MVERRFVSCGIISGTARRSCAQRSLTHSLGHIEEGLAMQATHDELPLSAYARMHGITKVDPSRRRTTTCGAASELRACAVLLDSGYSVFRSESPNAPFDLVAYQDGQLLRVEVKTLSPATSTSYAPVFTWPTNEEWDLLIIVGPDQIFQFRSPIDRETARDTIRMAYDLAPLGARRHAPPGALTADLITELRRRYKSGETRSALMAEFRLSKRTVEEVVKGHARRNVPDLDRCGSVGGYKLHLLRNEDPDACPECAAGAQRRRLNRKGKASDVT